MWIWPRETGCRRRLSRKPVMITVAGRSRERLLISAQVPASGAQVLTTTCPATKTALLEANRPGMIIRDIVELVAEAL